MANENAIYTEEYKGFTINIVPDDLLDNPRGWDNAGKMVCWHKRYDLGDEQPKEDPMEWKESHSPKDYIILPLYVYEHGGITISTSHGYPFNDRWDAGQVGWIYISKKDAVKEWGKTNFTKELGEKAAEHLRGEVKTFDDYLTGNVYGYEVCDEDGEVLDSCWGYYPDHDDPSGYEYCLNQAKDVADGLREDADEEAGKLAQMVAVGQIHG